MDVGDGVRVGSGVFVALGGKVNADVGVSEIAKVCVGVGVSKNNGFLVRVDVGMIVFVGVRAEVNV